MIISATVMILMNGDVMFDVMFVLLTAYISWSERATNRDTVGVLFKQEISNKQELFHAESLNHT